MATTVKAPPVMATDNDLFEVDATTVEHPAAPPRPVAERPRAATARGRSVPPL